MARASSAFISSAVGFATRHGAVAIVAMSVTSLACSQEQELLTSEIRSGLRMSGAAAMSPDDHLVELLVHAGHVYAANSGYGVGTMRLETDGGLT